MYHAAAGESHESGMQVGQCLGQVLAQAVSLIGVLWHQRHHVDVYFSLVQYQHLENGVRAVFAGRQNGLVLAPGIVLHVDGGIGQQLRVFAPSLGNAEHDAHLLGSTDIAQEYREIIVGAGLDGDTLEALVLKAEPFPALIVIVLLDALDLQAHIGGVVGMDTIRLPYFQRTQRMAGAYLFPGRAGPPSVSFCRAVLERAVLYQFGIETAVGRAADVFEEYTNKVVTDSLAAFGRGHGLLGLQTQCRCYEERSTGDEFFHNYC